MHSTAKPATPPERLRAVGTQLRMHAANELSRGGQAKDTPQKVRDMTLHL